MMRFLASRRFSYLDAIGFAIATYLTRNQPFPVLVAALVVAALVVVATEQMILRRK